jgi:hypothetical protein
VFCDWKVFKQGHNATFFSPTTLLMRFAEKNRGSGPVSLQFIIQPAVESLKIFLEFCLLRLLDLFLEN